MLHPYRSIHLILVALMMSVGLMVPAQPVQAADTEIAHIWHFAYQSNTNQGILTIKIVEHDKYTHEIITIFDEFVYTVPCGVSGLVIACDLDIRSAIQDSYLQMNLKEQAAKVRASESYRWMIVHATGQWASTPANAHSVLASHPSLQFAFDITAAKTVRFRTDWNTITTTSAAFKAPLGQIHTMINEFDCPQPTLCEITNAVMMNGSVKHLGVQQSNSTTVGFQLSPSQIQFTPPAGFQLDSFVIDPPKAGYG